jgi:serine/threonine protein kinase
MYAGRMSAHKPQSPEKAKVVSMAEKWTRPPSSGYQPVVEDHVTVPFEPGDVIGGKYEFIKLIGTGGMGFVVSATHIELGEKVALKFLRTECLANEELVGRFAREARASVKIKSEYVARVFDVGVLPDGAPFIVMEHLDGKDLFDIVRERGPLPVKTAVEYVMQACEALAAAHAAGVVHRDIKPENLFLTQRAQGMDIIKVLDFGISKVALTGSAFESKLPLVRTMMPMGSPVYMSPEQIRASRDIDARTDIWSLGCVLFELMTGTAAFDAPSLTQLSATILEQDAPPLRELCPEAPAELEAVVARCLEKDPQRRFQNIADLAIALYPFAPRRARISAERCHYTLKNAGLLVGEFDLPSVFPPPSMSMSESGTSLSLPGEVKRSSQSLAGSVGEIAPAARPSRSRGWMLGGAVLLLSSALGYAFFARGPAAAPPPRGAAIPVTAPAEVAAHPTLAPPAELVAAASANAPSANSGRTVAAPATRQRAAPTPRTRPSASVHSAAPSAPHEPDVGF